MLWNLLYRLDSTHSSDLEVEVVTTFRCLNYVSGMNPVGTSQLWFKVNQLWFKVN